MALVIYEWKDIDYLGADQAPDSLAPKQYICTSKAVSAGQCSLNQLGGFITTAPVDAESTIYTTPLRFGSGGSGAIGSGGHVLAPGSGDHDDEDGLRRRGLKFDRDMFPHVRVGRAGGENVEGTTHHLPGFWNGHTKVTQEGEPFHNEPSEGSEGWAGGAKPEAHTKVDSDGTAPHNEPPVKIDDDGDAPHNEAPHGGEVDDNPNVDGPEATSAAAAAAQTTEDTKGGTSGTDNSKKPVQAAEPDNTEKPDTVEEEKVPVKPPTPMNSAQIEGKVKQYTEPIHYKVPSTGYYCVGVVPVTLVKGDQAEQHERRVYHEDDVLDPRAANQRGSYEGVVTFRNQFQGELPAAEYPKIAVSYRKEPVTDSSSTASSPSSTSCSHAGGATSATSTTGSCSRCSGTSPARSCSS